MTAAASLPSSDWTRAQAYRKGLKSLDREHGFEPLEVVGAVPDALRGTLYRSGPALFESFGRPYAHPFEADGAITAVRFPGGGERPRGGSRVIQSAGLQAERAAGKPLYGSVAPWWRRVRNVLRDDEKNTGNTAMLHWQGRLFALMEAAAPTAIDPDTLQTLGEERWDGLVTHAFTAHPHRVPGRRSTVAFGLQYGPKNLLHLYDLPDVGAPRKTGSVPLPFATLVHDFAVTEKHAVFLIGPAPFVMWRAILQIGSFEDVMAWRPELGATVLVVPLDAPEQARRYEVDPCWVWHFGGAFEDRGEIVLDMSRYPDLASLQGIEGEDVDQASAARMVRMRIGADGVRSEQLWEGSGDFPIVHPDRVGRGHQHTWIVTDDGIARLDHGRETTAEVHVVPEHRVVTEPVFVPKEDGTEKEGWILSLTYDAERDRSALLVLDAANLRRPALAEVWFDQPIPITFHGTFVGA